MWVKKGDKQTGIWDWNLASRLRCSENHILRCVGFVCIIHRTACSRYSAVMAIDVRRHKVWVGASRSHHVIRDCDIDASSRAEVRYRKPLISNDKFLPFLYCKQVQGLSASF